MGGNAIKNAIRISKDEYHIITNNILDNLSNICNIKLIPSYKEKPDFGDADFLIEHPVDENAIISILNPIEIVKNGNVISLGLKINESIFQVDLIFITPEYFNSSYHYYSYNDISNLMGRIYHKAGFSYGHKGLKYTIRDNTHVISEIIVSTNTRKILEFMEFDYDQFLSGFTNLNDIFCYVTSNKYFAKEIFALENRNHISRTRDKKRITYQKFLTHIEPIETGFDWNNKEQLRKEFLHKAFEYFPSFKENHENAMISYNRRKKLNQKFNGKIVMELLDITGTELGSFMKRFKEKYSDDYLLDLNEEDIKTLVNNFI